jgi:hypothetical protein
VVTIVMPVANMPQALRKAFASKACIDSSSGWLVTE